MGGMTGIGATPCETCAHIRTLHPGGGKCVSPGCPCLAFVPVVPPVEEAEPERQLPRRVTFDVPDGYVVNVQLVPVAVTDAVETAEFHFEPEFVIPNGVP